MINLSKASGLPIALGDDNRLIFQPPLKPVEPRYRRLSDMVEYLRDSHAKFPKDIIYSMYRGIAQKDGLRYDLTVLEPGIIGEERVKTIGHYHQGNYPEIYEVIFGEAWYLLQERQKNSSQIKTVKLVKVKPGQKVIIPPGFGHVTINQLNKPLVMANWLAEDCQSDYEPYKRNHGAAYYILENGRIESNHSYQKLPKIDESFPREYPQYGLLFNKPMYTLINHLEKLDFLKIR